MRRITNFIKKNLAFFSIFFFLIFVGTEVSGQLTAKFTADATEGCTPFTIHFTNQSTTGDSISYLWDFGNGYTSTAVNPSTTYNNGGDLIVLLTVNDTKNGTTAYDTVHIKAIVTPPAYLSLNKTTACVNEYVTFGHSYLPVDSVRWDFGDGQTDNNFSVNPLPHAYKSNGSDTVTYITYNKNCSDTSYNVITVSGPVTNFTMSQNEACINQDITFAITDTTNVSSVSWDFGDGNVSTLDTVVHHYINHGYPIIPKLTVTGLGRSCILEDTLQVFHVEAGIGYSDNTLFCNQRYIYFQNESTGNDFNFWDFGDGKDTAQLTPRHIYQTGNYLVTLVVKNDFGCSDTITDSISIKGLPDIQLGNNWFVCEGGSVQLSASGGDIINWYPSDYLSDSTSYAPTATPPYTINYQAIVTDTVTKCYNTGYINVEVQKEPTWNVSVSPVDTSIIIGETAILQSTVNNSYKYNWSPDYQLLSRTDSTALVVRPLTTTTYTLTLTDSRDCFTKDYPVVVNVTEAYTIGLPKAFTPNNDQINDIIKVDGWGIKSLLEFKIYNRWGTEVYSGDDINSGWDGTYKNKPQPIDSYVYYIKAEMWDDKTVEKKGTFSLIR